MLRRNAVSLVLLCLTAALAGYLYFFDSARVTSGEAYARKRNLFKAFRRADITAIDVEKAPAQGAGNGDPERFRIEHRSEAGGDSTFYLDGELADQPAVDKLLSALEFATPERRVDAAVTRKETGLDAPRLRLSITMGNLRYRIAIGGQAPTPAGAAYAEVDGEGAIVAARDLVAELSRPRDAYRSRTLLPYLSSNLSEILLDGSGGSRRFVAHKAGAFAVSYQGHDVRVDRDAFDRLLSSLADIRAESFVSDPVAQSIWDKSDAKITLTLVPRDGPRALLELGGTCPSGSGSVVAIRLEPAPKMSGCVPASVMEPLAASLDRYTDRHAFSLRPDEMEEILISSGEKKLEIARAGKGWHMRAPSDTTVDHEVGQAFAESLRSLEGSEIVTDKEPVALGLVPPRATATVTTAGHGDDDTELETVELGGLQSGGTVFLRRSADGAVLRVTGDAAELLVPSSLSMRSLKVVDEPPGRVRRVSVDAGPMHQVLLRSQAGEFTFAEPKGFAPDPGVASQIVDALAGLRAARWVAQVDDGSFGFAQPSAVYGLELDDRTIKIEVGRKASGGVFARRSDEPGVFVLSAAAERVIETWAIDRSYAMIDGVNGVKVTRGDRIKMYSNAKAPDAGGTDNRIARVSPGDEAFETIKRALAEAHAEGTVHTGAPRKEEGFDKPLLVLEVTRATPQTRPIKIVVGRGDVFRDTSIFYVRREGVDATFAVAQNKLRPLLDLE